MSSIYPSAEPGDFTARTVFLTFLPSTTLQCDQIFIINDTILENNEVFSVELNSLDQAVIVGLRSATVTIAADNDGKLRGRRCNNISMRLCCLVCIADVTAGIQQMAYVAGEEDDPLLVCAILTGPTERSVVVTLQTVDRTAQSKYYVCFKYTFNTEQVLILLTLLQMVVTIWGCCQHS